MFDESVRARLELLNRQSLPAGPRTASGGSAKSPHEVFGTIESDVAHGISRPHLADHSWIEPQRTGHDQWQLRTIRYLEAGAEVENPAGRHLAIRMSWSLFGTDLPAQLERVQQAWTQHSADAEQRKIHPDVAALGRLFPRDALFLDLETCGLGALWSSWSVFCINRPTAWSSSNSWRVTTPKSGPS